MTNKMDSIKLYLKEVSKIPLIAKDEMEDIKKRILAGDDKARERLIKGNLRLVISIAKKYNRPNLDLNDLIEAGNMGLIAASNKFDPEKGAKFSTYSYDWIKEYISRSVLSHSKAIHIPVYIYQNFQKLLRAWDEITKKNGRTPRIAELAKETGFKQKDIKKFQYYIKIFSEIPSLDAPLSNEIDIPLKATIAASEHNDPEEAMGLVGMHQQIEQLLESVSERERQIIKYRFGIGTSHPHTLQDVGEKLNISRERVRQIQDKAMEKVKKAAIEIKKKNKEAVI